MPAELEHRVPVEKLLVEDIDATVRKTLTDSRLLNPLHEVLRHFELCRTLVARHPSREDRRCGSS